MTAYSQGTASLTQGSKNVTGALTTWLNMAAPGDLIYHAGYMGVVEQATGNTALTLKFPWAGPTVVATADYAILHVSSWWHSNVAINEGVRELLERINAGLGLRPDATGTLAQRAAFNAAAQGFVYLRTDVSPMVVFVKRSATSGDWSAGTAIGTAV